MRLRRGDARRDEAGRRHRKGDARRDLAGEDE